MVKVFVLVCFLIEFLIILCNGTSFLEAAIFLIPSQWILAFGIKEGEDTAIKAGAGISLCVFILPLILLKSSDRFMFIVLAALNLINAIVWAICSESDTPVQTGSHIGNSADEIWEIRKHTRSRRRRKH